MSSVAGGERGPAGTTARTLAQAKVNLVLRILAREANGYHQLETLFCRLEIGDDVAVRTDVRGRSLDCTGDALPSGGLGPVERNLAWQAAATYASAAGWPNEWAIEIDKRIPVGGGLGGGSADAGAVLRCLNALAPRPLSRQDLLALAGPLGADVPFLSIDAPVALGWGRGERLLELPALTAREAVLVCFPFGVATRDAYAWLDQAGGGGGGAVARSLEDYATWASVSRIAHNDFEAVVAPRFADIATALTALRAHAANRGDPDAIALLAGSGATVVLLTDHLSDRDVDVGIAAARTVRTRTATRVVDVEVSD